jgi:hypothetical protein
MHVMKFLVGLAMPAALAACDPPVQQQPKAGTSQDSGEAKSSDAKPEAPTAIISQDNPYQ